MSKFMETHRKDAYYLNCKFYKKYDKITYFNSCV